MTKRPIFKRLDVPVGAQGGVSIPFEMQPIVQLADGRVKACELLYRGQRPADWASVDAAMLGFLSVPRPGLPPVYVNLSNDILMSRGADELARVATANDVTFELSEAVSGYGDRAAIASKVNELIGAGVRVALDDFGAGRDGLQRLYAIGNVAAIKIDREFLLTCMRRQDARRMLCMLVAQWRQEGVRSIAEGVEDNVMFAFAQAIEVDFVQGWFVDSLVAMQLLGNAA
ncbi:EAL domain-containing protein [Massilia aerilata]|uniref:EAL domain-containing protein n=1 Tax=Massilia aerilata TaxID=453817 RepID=A0ABW0RZE5_9BURK